MEFITIEGVTLIEEISKWSFPNLLCLFLLGALTICSILLLIFFLLDDYKDLIFITIVLVLLTSTLFASFVFSFFQTTYKVQVDMSVVDIVEFDKTYEIVEDNISISDDVYIVQLR